MRNLLAIGLLFSGYALFGCGGTLPDLPPPSKDAPKVGPHQGIAYALPNEQGYAEVVNEPAVEGRGGTTPTSIVVYFLEPDAKTSLAQTPEEVKFNVNAGRSGTRTVALRAEPKAEDPVGKSRFASDTGPYRIEELRGDLIVTLGGNPIKISVAEGR